MSTGSTLLLIDVQKDFHPGGSLAIPSADKDAERIAGWIDSNIDTITRIVATLDTHQKLHIAHPSFWYDNEKNHPAPFTIISAEDLRKGIWKPRSDVILPADNSSLLDPKVFAKIENVQDDQGKFDIAKYVIEYAERLEEKGRFKLCIWPEHCLIGSTGHGMVDCVQEAMYRWSEKTGRTVEWVLKGQNLLTEMYSALAADVPVSEGTDFNSKLQESLMKSEKLVVCGQAMSHCVNYTLRDIVDHWPKEERSKIILLTDCASSVPGFEGAGDDFQSDMKESGVQLMKSSDL